MQEDNRRLSGRQRAKHDHLLAGRSCLLRDDTPFPARPHVSHATSFSTHTHARVTSVHASTAIYLDVLIPYIPFPARSLLLAPYTSAAVSHTV